MSLQKTEGEKEKIVEKILRSIVTEKSGIYLMDRDAKQYNNYFLGLSHFFSYVEETDTLPDTIVEIGVGKGNGFSQIAKDHSELQFIGTALNTDLVTAKIPDNATVQMGATEELHQIKDRSVGGIYGLYSVSYSDPGLAIKRMDEVLAPGGAIKLVLTENDTEGGMTGFATFAMYLEELGYSWHAYTTSTTDTISTIASERGLPHVVLTAIKPDTERKTMPAKELFNLDLQNFLRSKMGALQYNLYRLRKRLA